ncbi:MAG TPA: hypothetical protein VGH20_03500 [Myxococcales bacterium]
MAVLLNQTSNLQLRIELLERISDGQKRPASLAMRVSVERYRKEPRGFVSMLAVPRATLLDMDLIQFLRALEELLDGRTEAAALEASVDPAIGLRLAGGPEAYLVEAGVDLLNVLHPVGSDLPGERGADLMLVRFAANKRAALAFCSQLLEDFSKFPTDPAQVDKGPRE